jgi:hypothetical protein
VSKLDAATVALHWDVDRPDAPARVERVRWLRAPSPEVVVSLLESPGVAPGPPDELGAALLGRLADRSDGKPRRLDAFVVEHGAARFAAPFRWSARAARRTLGTGALRRVAEGTARDLRHGAREELSACCDRARRGLARRGALGTWLASQGPEVRGLCAVEAMTWAAGLAQLLDLDANAARLHVGVPDAWRAVPGARTTLHGRRDAVSRATGALLRLRDGAPGVRALDGLAVDGLVASLAADAPPPCVLGAWPDAGVLAVVELEDGAVRRAARALLDAIGDSGDVLEAPAALVA